MERNKKSPSLFLFLALPLVSTIKVFSKEHCPSLPVKNLTCYNNYNDTITCEWNSTYVTDHANTVCTIVAENLDPRYGYKGSCTLKTVDVARPTVKKCSVVFKSQWRNTRVAGSRPPRWFQSFDILTITLSCKPEKESCSISYQPSCHIKLDPPPKPHINLTTVSWTAQTTKIRASPFDTQLQWRQADKSWSQTYVNKDCKWDCKVELNEDDLIKDERYEARVRVQTKTYLSTWSDWSPTTSWVSSIGGAKPTETPPQSDVTGGVLGAVASVAAVALVLILLKIDRTIWIYMVKKIRGPPLPTPGKSFLQDVNFQKQLTPYFTSESFQALLKPVEIASVEVTSTVDAVTPSGLEAALQEKMRIENSYESTRSSFSNPSYSQMSPPLPPVSSLTAGNLAPCGADTPYGPVASQDEEKSAEQDREEVKGKEVEILELLSKGSINTEPMLVISDYEKVEKPLAERFRLQSLDSGVCSGEEVSQESLEANSINISDFHDERPEATEEREEGNGKEGDFQRLFGGTFYKGSIQICSDYEQVQALQADCPELASPDSAISSRGEEQLSQEESLEDVDQSTECTSTLFPFPLSPPLPLPSSALACSLHSFTPMPLNMLGPGLSPALQPLPVHIPERVALMTTNVSVEPSADGYMPKQNLQPTEQ